MPRAECPRADGKTGWKGLRLRPDLVGTEDGLARIQAQAIRRAEHAGKTCGLSVTIDRAGGRACLAEGAARIAIRSGNRSALMHQERSGGSYCQTESESKQYGELGKGQEFGFGLVFPVP